MTFLKNLALWRLENMSVETIVVIVLAAMTYGAAIRIGGHDRINEK